MKLIRLTLFFCLFFILPGCQTTDFQPQGITYQSSPLWSAHYKQLSQLNTFTISGRIQVLPLEGDSAQFRFHWEHNPLDETLLFKDWLGKTVLQIKGTPGHLIVTPAEGHPFLADNIEDAAHQLLGIPLPANGLASWIRGIPTHSLAIDSLLVSTEGFAQLLHQGVWDLQFNHYQPVGIHMLPHTLLLKHPSYGQLHLKIHLWQIG